MLLPTGNVLCLIFRNRLKNYTIIDSVTEPELQYVLQVVFYSAGNGLLSSNKAFIYISSYNTMPFTVTV